MKLELEFIRHKKISWTGVTLCLLSLGLAVWQTAELGGLSAWAQSVQAQSAALETAIHKKRQSVLQIEQSGVSESEAQRQANLKIIRSLNYPWNRVLFDIEQKPANEVALLSFVHSQATQQSELLTLAKDPQALIRFVDNLNAGSNDHQWYIAHYQTEAFGNALIVRGRILNRRIPVE